MTTSTLAGCPHLWTPRDTHACFPNSKVQNTGKAESWRITFMSFCCARQAIDPLARQLHPPGPGNAENANLLSLSGGVAHHQPDVSRFRRQTTRQTAQDHDQFVSRGARTRGSAKTTHAQKWPRGLSDETWTYHCRSQAGSGPIRAPHPACYREDLFRGQWSSHCPVVPGRSLSAPRYFSWKGSVPLPTTC